MKKYSLVLIFGLLFTLLFVNTFHEEYPDEYDSILGGRYITEGKIPYRDWFQHHQPGAYVVASCILPFSGTSFIRFRILLAITYFFNFTTGYFIVKSRVIQKNIDYYLWGLLFVALAGTYFWGQMLLADTLAAYFMIPPLMILMIKGFYREKFELADLAIVTAFLFFVWCTSMTFSFMVIGLLGCAGYMYVISRNNKKRAVLTAFMSIAAPFILYFGFFLVTGGLKDWYFANVTYNQEYYIYNYPREPGTRFNPVRYAIILAHEFFNNYIPPLTGIAGLNFFDPLIGTLVLSSATFIYAAWKNKRYLLGFIFLYALIYACARSNPSSFKQTDYQSSMYFVISVFAGFFALHTVKKSRDAMAVVLSVTLTLYMAATALFFFQNFLNIFYPKYMGTMPLIYDRPQIAQYLNRFVSPGDYVYIGPFDFKENWYLKTENQPSKYHWFLQHAASSKIKDELIADLKKNKPLVIVFRRGYAPWGGNAHEFNYFMQEFLDRGYFQLYQLDDPKHEYRYTMGDTQDFVIDRDFNFDTSRKDEIIRRLLEAGIIKDVKSE